MADAAQEESVMARKFPGASGSCERAVMAAAPLTSACGLSAVTRPAGSPSIHTRHPGTDRKGQ
jgi:hypothetical protein